MLQVHKGRDSVLNILNFNLSLSKNNFQISFSVCCLLEDGILLSNMIMTRVFFLSFEYHFYEKYLGNTQFYMLQDTSLKCFSFKITNGARYL